MAAKKFNNNLQTVDSDVALMGIRGERGGWTALFLINADGVEDWIRTYGDAYQEVTLSDYRDHWDTSRYRKRVLSEQ